MKQQLIHLGIRQKILFVVALTMSIAVLLISGILGYINYSKRTDSFISSMESISMVISQRSSAAVAFLDKENALSNLEPLQYVDHVVFACLYNSQTGTVLASLQKSLDSETKCDVAPSEISVVLDKTLWVHKVIIKKGRPIGGFVLKADISHITNANWALVGIILSLGAVSCIFSLMLTSGLQKLIYVPIIKLSKLAKELSETKNWDLRASKYTDDELGDLSDIFNEMVTIIQEDQKKLKELAYNDPLTGLPNRRMFEEKLEQCIAKSRRYHNSFGVIFIDLDNFKWVNDTLGHDQGDKLLIELSKRFQAVMREEDTLARIGGDEFTVVTEAIRNENDMEELAQRLLDSLIPEIMLGTFSYQAKTSLGIAIGDGEEDNLYSIMKKADIAVYAAKEAGKNNFKTYALHMGPAEIDPSHEARLN